jgi:glycosyltransferase involved in cell wall biosynthesis
MKIIALMPVKNEAWILPSTYPQLRRFVDQVIVLDGGSTDGTHQYLKANGAIIFDQKDPAVKGSEWRQFLLDEGRARGGTHFIWLDADETFTSNFWPKLRDVLDNMRPGQALMMDWLCLWKSPFKLRFDNSVWTILPKDFVFCDDGLTNFQNVADHEPRTPVVHANQNLIRIERSAGAVLHFQFVPFLRFQTKQAYFRCRELVYWNRDPLKINESYQITLDKKNIHCINLPSSWISGIENLDHIYDMDGGWYRDLILSWFEEYGIDYFEKLDIWYIPEFLEMFKFQMGRDPIIQMPQINKTSLYIALKTQIKYYIQKHSIK